MTVERIDAVTGEVVELTEAEARRLTERIRSALDRVSTAWADLAERVHEAQERRADLALGYDSWAEYVETELKPPAGMAVEARRQLVGLLSGLGMSTRAIAPVVGAPRETVRRDALKVTHSGSPAPAERIDPATGEVLDLAPLAPEGKSLGLDGKTYTRPQATGPKETQKETTMTAAPSRLAIPQPPRRTPNRPADLELASTTGMQQGHPPEPTPMGAPAWLLFG